MSDLTVTPTEAPEFTTGYVAGEILGLRKRRSKWKDPDTGQPTEGTFLTVDVGLSDPKRKETIDYPWSDEPTLNSSLGQMLDRFDAFHLEEDVDLEDALVGRDVEVHVTAAEDRDPDPETGEPQRFAEFDRDTLEPA